MRKQSKPAGPELHSGPVRHRVSNAFFNTALETPFHFRPDLQVGPSGEHHATSEHPLVK